MVVKNFFYVTYLLLIVGSLKSSPPSTRAPQEFSGFYSPEDDIILLNGSNINQIIGSRYGWIVEFYASYCGHCVKMVPSWKKFAKKMKPWSAMVKVAAFNCDEEMEMCHDFGAIMVPLVKYFHENFQHTEDTWGVKLNHNNLDRSFLEIVKEDQRNGNGKIYPNILPYWSSMSNMLQERGENNSCFLIVQNSNSSIGPEVILDLHSFPNVCVQYTYTNNTHIEQYAIADQLLLPAILTASNVKKDSTNIDRSRKDFVNFIKGYLVNNK